MRARLLLTLSALCLASLSAHADTFQRFNVNATFANGATLTGTVDLDESYLGAATDGSVANLTYTLNGSTVAFDGSASGAVYTPLPYNTGVLFTADPDGLLEGLFLMVPAQLYGSFEDYNGGNLCVAADPAMGCANAPSRLQEYPDTGTVGNINYIISGSLTPVTLTATPEPSTLALFGTGLLGVAGVARRRFA